MPLYSIHWSVHVSPPPPMPIPTYQEMMLPLLRVLGTAGRELHQKDYSALTAEALGLSEEQRQERLPSGLQTYVFNRAGWAGWYMQQAGLVEKPKRGHLRISASPKMGGNSSPRIRPPSTARCSLHIRALWKR